MRNLSHSRALLALLLQHSSYPEYMQQTSSPVIGGQACSTSCLTSSFLVFWRCLVVALPWCRLPSCLVFSSTSGFCCYIFCLHLSFKFGGSSVQSHPQSCQKLCRYSDWVHGSPCHCCFLVPWQRPCLMLLRRHAQPRAPLCSAPPCSRH